MIGLNFGMSHPNYFVFIVNDSVNLCYALEVAKYGSVAVIISC